MSIYRTGLPLEVRAPAVSLTPGPKGWDPNIQRPQGGLMKTPRRGREPPVVTTILLGMAGSWPLLYILPSVRAVYRDRDKTELEVGSVGGRVRLIFPSAALVRHASRKGAALRRLGYAKTEMTGHGFRAMARTILDEVLGVRPDFIEHQLAHTVRDPLGRAYNRTTHLAERRAMMQRWADYLDSLQTGAEVVPLRARSA